MWLLSQSAQAPEWTDLLLGPLGALALSLAANVWLIRELRRVQGLHEAMTAHTLETAPLLADAVKVLRKEKESES